MIIHIQIKLYSLVQFFFNMSIICEHFFVKVSQFDRFFSQKNSFQIPYTRPSHYKTPARP